LIGEGDFSFATAGFAVCDLDGGVNRSASFTSVFAFLDGGGVAAARQIAEPA
jgi:hypothetical protein